MDLMSFPDVVELTTGNGPELDVANRYLKYNWVIYIDGEELYDSGTGTEKDPYIID